MSRSEKLAYAAERFEAIAAELDRAAKHCLTAARHYRAEDVPPGCAHAFAARGHLRTAHDGLDELAQLLAAHAAVDGE